MPRWVKYGSLRTKYRTTRKMTGLMTSIFLVIILLLAVDLIASNQNNQDLKDLSVNDPLFYSQIIKSINPDDSLSPSLSFYDSKQDQDLREILNLGEDSAENYLATHVYDSLIHAKNQPSTRKKVLIVAEYRGGSTFTAEVFNKNPKASYLFEPLFLPRRFEYIRERHKISAKILYDYFVNCKYPKYSSIMEQLYQNQNKPWNQINQTLDRDYKKCKDADTCFFKKSNLQHEIFQNYGKNPELLEKYFQQACFNSEITAAKVIRLDSLSILEVLQTLGQKFLQDFYVIYLIRDPRGMYNSRSRVVKGWTDNVERWKIRNLPHQCDPIMENYEYITSNQGAWLRKHILFIRYEDLALNSELHLEEIYKFIGCDTQNNHCGFQNIQENFQDVLHISQNELDKMNKKFSHAYDEMTDYQRDQMKFIPDDISDRNIQKWQLNQRMRSRFIEATGHTTSNRDAAKTAFNWIGFLKWIDIKKLQDTCDPKFWDLFGYKKYSNSINYRKDIFQPNKIDRKSLKSSWIFSKSNGR